MYKLLLHNVTAEYQDGKSLRDFSFDFTPYHLIGILDKNEEQSGQFLKIISRIAPVVSGNILIGETDISKKSASVEMSNISYVFESGGILSNLTILENLLLPFDFHFPNTPRKDKLVLINEYFNLFELDEALLMERPAKISICLRKVIQIIRAMITKPNIIFYQQPFTHLDLKHQNQVFKLIQSVYLSKEAKQFFSTNFYPALLKLADIILVFCNGVLIEKGSWEKINNSDSEYIKKLAEAYLEV